MFYLAYGGDDGARTRDLCRDRSPQKRNLLKQRVADGSNSAIGKPWEALLTPYRTHVLCPFVLCRGELTLIPPDFGRGREFNPDLLQQRFGHPVRAFSYARQTMRLLRQFAVVLMLLASCATPVMACSTPGPPMTVAKRDCCRMMHNNCERMGMPASSPCCQKALTGAQDYIIEPNAANHQVVPPPTLLLSMTEVYQTTSARAGWVEHADYSPPQSPPRSISVLRI